MKSLTTSHGDVIHGEPSNLIHHFLSPFHRHLSPEREREGEGIDNLSMI